MPQAVFIPAQLNDLAVDVLLSGVAQGDLFYRGASKWNNLPHGTSGQPLLTQGAAADPLWGALNLAGGSSIVTGVLPAANVDLSGDVILAPATSARNVIVPTLDNVCPFAVRRHSATQSANLMEYQDENGVLMSGFDSGGRLGLGTAPVSTQRLTMQTVADANKALVVMGHSATQSGDLFEAQWFDGTVLTSIGPSGAVLCKPQADGAGIFRITNAAGTGGGAGLGEVVRVNTTTDVNNLKFTVFDAPGILLATNNRYSAIAAFPTLADPAPTVGAQFAAFECRPIYTSSATLSGLFGFYCGARNQGAGTVTQLTGLRIDIRNTVAGGTVVTSTGIEISNPILSGAGATFTTVQGLHILQQGRSGITDASAIIIDNQVPSGASNSNFAIQSLGGQNLFLTGAATTKALVLKGFTAQSANIFEIQDVNAAILMDWTSAGNLEMRRTSSTTGGRLVGTITGEFNSNTDATYTGRLKFSATDASGTREGLRIEGDGSMALVGIGGATLASTHVFVQSTADANKGIVFRGFSGTQSGNALEVQNSAATALAILDANGQLGLNTVPAFRFHAVVTGASDFTMDRYGGVCGMQMRRANGTVGSPTALALNDFIFMFRVAGHTGSAFTGSRGLLTCRASEAWTTSANGLLWTISTVPNGTSTSVERIIFADQGQLSLGAGFNSATDVRPAQLTVEPYVNTLPACALNGISGQTGVMLLLTGRSSTTSGREMGALDTAWISSTDATRTGRVILSATDFNARREGFRIEADGSNPRLGVLGAAAIARPASYTLAGSATRVFPADPSSSYTGLDNTQVGAVYASVANLNTLRGAVSSLEGLVRQLIVDLASTSGYGFLVAS